MTRIPIRRALISIYDKTGLGEPAFGLYAAGVEIISGQHGGPDRRGRVKTLHLGVHADLLADTANPVTGALWHRADVLRYGENPHQRAALYARPRPGTASQRFVILAY